MPAVLAISTHIARFEVGQWIFDPKLSFRPEAGKAEKTPWVGIVPAVSHGSGKPSRMLLLSDLLAPEETEISKIA